MRRREKTLLTISEFPKSWKMKKAADAVIDAFIKLKLLPANQTVVMSISSANPLTMKSLNRKFRKINKPTDVLSFELEMKPKINGFCFLGDLVLCPKIIEKQARSLKPEILIMLTHGIFHLLGYDHEKSKKQHTEMLKLELKVLKKLGIREGLIQRMEAKPQSRRAIKKKV